MGYIGYGMLGGLGAGIIQGQNKTGMGSENIGEFAGSTAKHLAVGAGAGVAMNVARNILEGKGAGTNALGVAAAIAGGAFMSTRF